MILSGKKGVIVTMKKGFLRVIVLLLTASMLAAFAPGVYAESDVKDKTERVEGEAIVVLKDNAKSKCLDKNKSESVYGKNIKLKKKFILGEDKKTKVASVKSSDKTTDELIDELKQNENVKYAVPNHIVKKCAVTNDTYSDYQWALKNSGQNSGTDGCDTKAESLWNKSKYSSRESVVAVLDTGVDASHEDLKDNLWVNPYQNKLKGVNGCDCTGTIADGSPYDDDGHGTHLSGIIAGCADNQKGISGINKYNTKIMAVKIMNGNGEGTFEEEIAGYEYVEKAVSLGVNVVAINGSFGYIENTETKKVLEEFYDELGEMGVVVCIASGNEYANLNDIHKRGSRDYKGMNNWFLPACCESKYCITVAASDENDKFATFSNTGDEYVDIAAPGVNILSTYAFNTFNPGIYSEQKRAEVCEHFQDFSAKPAEGEFGSYTLYGTGFFGWTNASESTEDIYFGTKKGSLSIDGSGYYIEIPFTIDDKDSDYYISFMLRSSDYSNVYFDDLPLDYDFDDDLDDIDDFYEFHGGNDWDHYQFNSGPSNRGYIKDKNRKLVIYVENCEGTISVDDLGISKQGVDENKFGKYEYCGGTSMACPYIAGAVALIKNSYKDISPADVINMLKTKGRVCDSLKGGAENGVTLSLDKTESYSYTPTGPTVLPVITDPTNPSNPTNPNYNNDQPEGAEIHLHRNSASLYVGAKTQIEFDTENIINNNASYSSSNKSVATVSGTGKVTAKKKGNAVITVKIGSVSAKFKVKVKNPYLKVKSKKLKVKKKYKIKIVGKNGKATFKSANKKIATVTKKGVVKAKKKGKTTITVKTNGNVKLKFKVKVK